MKKRIFTLIDNVIRIYLSISLFGYSIAKILNVQFSNNRDFYLSKRVADLTGKDLVWVFYGYSREYEFCIGIIQLFSVILLFFDRTKILGMLILIPLFLNIFLIDLFYSVHALYIVEYYFLLLIILILINQAEIIYIFKRLLSKNNSYNLIQRNYFNYVFIIIGIIILFLISLFINKYRVFK